MFHRALSATLRFVRPTIVLRPQRITKISWLLSNSSVNNVARRTCIATVDFGSKKLYSTDSNAWTDDDFKRIFDNDKLVVFMKGTPDAPQCGFSKHVIQILYMHGCENYKTFNVLDDDVLRSRVKEFSNWPTIPQVYLNGEFIAGFDILLQMHQNGELIEELEKIGHRSALIDAEPSENDK